MRGYQQKYIRSRTYLLQIGETAKRWKAFSNPIDWKQYISTKYPVLCKDVIRLVQNMT